MVCSHLIHCGYAFFVVLYRFFVDQRVHLYNSSIANTKTQKTSRDTAPLDWVLCTTACAQGAGFSV